MKTIRNIWILFFMTLSVSSFSQNLSSLGFWHQRSVHGEVRMEGLWRQQQSFYETTRENWRSLYGMAGFKLMSRSYLWLPSLATLDVDLEFNPETRKERYILTPNRSEVRTLNKVGIRSTLLSKKTVTIMPFYSYNQSYFNRETLTNIRSKTQRWGGTVLLKNKYLPFNLSYNNMKWNQKETETGRVFTNDRKTLEGRSSWNITSRDKNELVFGHDDFTYTYSDADTTRNIVSRINMNNHIYLDSAKHYSVSSFINYFDQSGTYNFKRFEVYERFLFNLPYNLRLNTTCNFYSLKDLQDLKQNRVMLNLSHKLYQSLKTNIFGEYVYTNQTVYKESNLRFGAGFDYTKKIGSGRLNLSYHYFRRHLGVNSFSSSVTIINESHTLTDITPTLLDKPYIDQNSIVVKDATGTIIYQLNFDYILIKRNDFIEIQRIMGGQISNAGIILVDYTATQPGDYRYDMNNHRIYIGFLVFHRLLEVYYRWGLQDYSNIMQTGFLTLKHFNQNIIGIRMDKGFARGGIEYDKFSSNIIPYHMMRYYFNLQKNFKNKLLLTLNASLRDYRYVEDGGQQILGNLSGMASYAFKSTTRLEMEIGYLRHKAYMTDLNMWTGKLEISTAFRQLYLNTGFDFYRRNYKTTKFTLNGVFVRLTRKF